MRRTVSAGGNSVVRFLARFWGAVPLPVQGLVFVGLPLIAVAFSVVMTFFGTQQRGSIEAAVQRHFQTVQGFNDVLALMVNAETGMRGYLLTGRDEFLEPYAIARRNLPGAMANLRALVEAKPSPGPRRQKLGRLDELKSLIDRQMTELAAEQELASASKPGGTELYVHLANGKRLMDRIRGILVSLQSDEERLLSRRLQDINAIHRRDYQAAVIALFLALGTRLLVWYLFDVNVLRRIRRLADNVRSLGSGRPLPFPPTGKPDALGDIENEIALASERRMAAERQGSLYICRAGRHDVSRMGEETAASPDAAGS